MHNNKNELRKWKKLVIPYQKIFVFYGLIFFMVSFIVTKKPTNIIIEDLSFAIARMTLMTVSMAFYVVTYKSGSLMVALRSIWYLSKFEFKWVEKIIIFLELSIRFFPLMQQKWYFTQRSQKALSMYSRGGQYSKVIQYSKYLPDFIILNLDQAEKIVKNMSLRGFGEKPKRSAYPIVIFNVYEFFIIILISIIIMSIHFVEI